MLRIYEIIYENCGVENSLRSRRWEVVGERENGRARGRHARLPLVCLPLTRPFFLVPTTFTRLLRRLGRELYERRLSQS